MEGAIIFKMALEDFTWFKKLFPQGKDHADTTDIWDFATEMTMVIFKILIWNNVSNLVINSSKDYKISSEGIFL